jgi:alkyl sulfatase BDS1-like metallo-beta-lactamase superfamily hydrolase
VAIRETVLDYFEGWFDGDPARMERALHPDLAKRSVAEDGTGLDHVTAREMIGATAAGR